MSDRGNHTSLRGIPDCLLPREGVKPDPFTIVRDGPRNLAQRPFDYRNPFPVQPLEQLNADEHNGSNALPSEWPIDDSGETFDYYLNSRAAIGLPGGPECALVDFYGTLRAFTGAWAFGLGPAAAPPQLRVRRLLDGCLPVVLAEAEAEGVSYSFEYFAAEIDGAAPVDYLAPETKCYRWVGAERPQGRNLFFCARLRVSATDDRPARVTLGFAQRACLCTGSPSSGGAYAPAWNNLRLEGDEGTWRLLADDGDDAITLAVLLCRGGEVSPSGGRIDHWPNPLSRAPDRPARLCSTVATNGELEIAWVVPCFPVQAREDGALLESRPAQLRSSSIELWRQRRSGGMQFHVPEPKVQGAYTQALNHLDMCLVTLGDTQFPTPGPSGGYHQFFGRDSVDLIYAYDLVGDHERAARMIEQYRLHEVDQETSGMVLWLLGRHFAFTRDGPWLDGMKDEIIRRMSWMVQAWNDGRDAHGGLLPPTSLVDNELIRGQFVSYHLYAVAGAREAAAMAATAGWGELAAEWSDFYDEFSASVVNRLGELVERTDGVITPGFAGYDAEPVMVPVPGSDSNIPCAGAYGERGGVDWHNFCAAFPTGVLPPDHPWISSSLERWRHSYVEGAFPYPREDNYHWLHNYNTLNLSETWLRRGDYAEAIRDLYGALLHTSATHGSAEVVDSAGRRDFCCTPHGWFGAKVVRFIRDLLVYEGEDHRIHLLAGLSPAWMAPGAEVRIEDAPTDLGKLSLCAGMRDGGMDVDVLFDARADAAGIVLHLPPFLDATSVTADGQRHEATHSAVPLPATARAVEVKWRPATLPDISFDAIAAAFKENYHGRVLS